MPRTGLVVLLFATLALAACGESKEEKASKQVCDARADIAKQVDTLSSMTLSTATTTQIRQSLGSIRNSLSQIKSAQPDLSDSRRAQVTSANEAFTAQVKSVTSSLGTSVSLSAAAQQLTTALQQLATSYRTTLARVDCNT